MAIPVNLLPVGDGHLPDGSRAIFFVDRRTPDTLEEVGPAWKIDDAGHVVEAVTDPDAIFVGLGRPNQADSLCYCVRPTRRPDAAPGDPPDDVPPVFGQVFLAFAAVGQMGYLVFDWEWRVECPDEAGHPAGWGDDFERRVWHRP